MTRDGGRRAGLCWDRRQWQSGKVLRAGIIGRDDVLPHSVLDYLAKRHGFVHRSNRQYELCQGDTRMPLGQICRASRGDGVPHAQSLRVDRRMRGSRAPDAR